MVVRFSVACSIPGGEILKLEEETTFKSPNKSDIVFLIEETHNRLVYKQLVHPLVVRLKEALNQIGIM